MEQIVEEKGRKKTANEREKSQTCLDSSEREQARPKVKVAIDIVKANVFAVIIMIVAAIVFLVPFFWIWKDKKTVSELFGGFGDWIWVFVLMFVGVVIHDDVETAHALLPLRRADAHPRLYVWSHDALHRVRHHPCCCSPFHRQSAHAGMGNILHCRSRWRHLDDVALNERESQEPRA